MPHKQGCMSHPLLSFSKNQYGSFVPIPTSAPSCTTGKERQKFRSLNYLFTVSSFDS